MVNRLAKGLSMIKKKQIKKERTKNLVIKEIGSASLLTLGPFGELLEVLPTSRKR